jgi:arginase
MRIIYVPYHLDEHLPDLDLPLPPLPPLPPDREVSTVVEALPEGDVWTRLGGLYTAVATAVASGVSAGVSAGVGREAGAGSAVAVLSGDCMASLGVVAGLQRAGIDPSIVWFDAHGDVQTLETTTSGYVGGMPLRILVGYRPELISQRIGLRAVPEDRTVLVDARDLDPPEAEYLAAARIRRSDVAGLAEDRLPDGPLVLHVDLDVVDPEDLPGLRYPAPGGPAVTEVLAAARRVLDTGRVAALSLGCTWHPGHGDPAGVRSRVLSALI